MQNIQESFDSLPVEYQRKVYAYIESLRRAREKRKRKLSLNWAGGLKEYKSEFTSVELQKKSLEWWTG